jgi:hypothetical protein
VCLDKTRSGDKVYLVPCDMYHGNLLVGLLGWRVTHGFVGE